MSRLTRARLSRTILLFCGVYLIAFWVFKPSHWWDLPLGVSALGMYVWETT